MIFLYLIGIILFIARVIFFASGWWRINCQRHLGFAKNQWPTVDLIIPARNEEANIATCLAAVAKLKYPLDKLKVIVVNDRSTDRTGIILQKLVQAHAWLSVVKLTAANLNRNLTGKSGALQAGADSSNGEIIVMTDADCLVQPAWLKNLVAPFAEVEVGLVAGYTVTDGRLWFDRLQSLEWLYMNSLAAGGVGWGRCIGCFGNNLAVRRRDFETLGGYHRIKFCLTEDLALQQAICSLPRQAVYLSSPQTLAHTKPCQSLAEYFRQHHRWAQGGRRLGGWTIFGLVLSLGVLIISLLAAIFNGDYVWVLAILLTRALGDAVILIPVLRQQKINYLWLWLVPAVIWFTAMEILAPYFLLYKKVIWKGQVLEN